MNELTIFNNPDFGTVRTIEQDGRVYFCGADVARALGYSNSRKALADHCKEKGVTKCDTLTNGGIQILTYIDEGNLYRLISHSKLPEAEKFESWIFDVVLPAIRKHGAYMTPGTIEQAVRNPDFVIGLLIALKEEQKQKAELETTVAFQSQQLDEYQPKASYYDVILSTKDAVSVTDIAKDYGKSAKWLNQKLFELKIQYYRGKRWYLYQEHADKGYTCTKTQPYSGKNGETHSKVHMYWTQAGRKFIYDELKKRGIVPVIERMENVA